MFSYLEELRGGDGEKAVERTQTSVGCAMLYTSLIVILGFSLLAFSDSRGARGECDETVTRPPSTPGRERPIIRTRKEAL